MGDFYDLENHAGHANSVRLFKNLPSAPWDQKVDGTMALTYIVA